MRTRIFKKTAVSHDRTGAGSPLTAKAIMQTKNKNSEENLSKRNRCINMSKITQPDQI